MDQPAGLLEKMSTCINVYNAMLARKKYPGGHEAEFARANPEAWETYLMVRELRGN